MVVLAIALSPTFLAGQVTAASNPQTAVTISPASTAPSLKPGGSQLYNLTVFNNGDSSYNARVYANPYRVVGVDYDPAFTQVPGTTDPSAWVKLSKSTIFVPAHETVVVPYTLTIPANTAPGGYYAVIFIETQPVGGSQGVQMHSRVGNVLYITAQGPVQTGGTIVNLPIPHLSMASSIPLSFEVTNTGGVHYLTNATVTVNNLLGKTSYKAYLERYVLPQTVRELKTTWKTSPIGFYTVHRNATVNGTLQSLPAQWIVVVHPWVIIVMGLILVLLIVSFFLKRRLAKKETNKETA